MKKGDPRAQKALDKLLGVKWYEIRARDLEATGRPIAPSTQIVLDRMHKSGKLAWSTRRQKGK